MTQNTPLHPHWTERLRLGRCACLVLLGFLTAWPAAAVDLQFGFLFGFYPTLKNCGIEVSTFQGTLATEELQPLGVQSGPGGVFSIEGPESIEFDFDEPAYGARYTVQNATDGNNDGVFAPTMIEAFGPDGFSIGTVMTSGSGLKSVGDLFGDVLLSGFLLIPMEDSFQVSSVGYDESGEVEIDLDRSGDHVNNTFFGDQLYCGANFSGSDEVRVFHANGNGGMGIRGGVNDFLLDTFETMRVDLPYPVSTLVVESLLVNFDGDSVAGNATLTAFDEAGDAIGDHLIGEVAPSSEPVQQVLDVSALFPGETISSIEIAANRDGRRLDRLVYAPEPASAWLLSAGSALLLGASRKRFVNRA